MHRTFDSWPPSKWYRTDAFEPEVKCNRRYTFDLADLTWKDPLCSFQPFHSKFCILLEQASFPFTVAVFVAACKTTRQANWNELKKANESVFPESDAQVWSLSRVKFWCQERLVGFLPVELKLKWDVCVAPSNESAQIFSFSLSPSRNIRYSSQFSLKQ